MTISRWFPDRRAPVAMCLAALIAAPALRGQSIDRRVGGIADGTVRLAYAARPGLCRGAGSGTSWGTNGVWFSSGSDDDTELCASGPVRVSLRRSAGRTIGIHVAVGGRWAATDNGTDLGLVAAPEAAPYFVAEAARLEGREADHALDAAAVADSVDILPDLERLARDRDIGRRTRQRAVFWIASHDEPAARTALHELISDRSLDDDTRGTAIVAISREIPDADVRFLREQYPQLPSKLRDNVFLAISRSDSPLATSWLTDVATNAAEPEHDREQALFWLGQGNAPTSSLVALYPRLSDAALRRHYTFVLSRRQDPGALDALIDVARHDSDREVRRQALFWLGRSHDPRAVTFLEEMVTR